MKNKQGQSHVLGQAQMTIRGRCVGGILDTRFEVTRTTLNLGSFDVEMKLDLYDVEMVALFSLDDVEMEFDSFDMKR